MEQGRRGGEGQNRMTPIVYCHPVNEKLYGVSISVDVKIRRSFSTGRFFIFLKCDK